MTRYALFLTVLLIALSNASWAKQSTQLRFLSIAVYGDPQGQSLSSYQVIAHIENAQTKIVGITNGEHAAYSSRPPYYDSQALAERQQLVIAQYSLNDDLPRAKTRLFSINIMTQELENPVLKLELIAATEQSGQDTPLNLSFSYEGDRR